MMSAPDARTSSGRIAFTVAAVPTGMNAGVRISPRCIAIAPALAAPSVADIVKENRVTGDALSASTWLWRSGERVLGQGDAAYPRLRPLHLHRRCAPFQHHDDGPLAESASANLVSVRQGTAFLLAVRPPRSRRRRAQAKDRARLSRPLLRQAGGRTRGRDRRVGFVPLYARTAG